MDRFHEKWVGFTDQSSGLDHFEKFKVWDSDYNAYITIKRDAYISYGLRWTLPE